MQYYIKEWSTTQRLSSLKTVTLSIYLKALVMRSMHALAAAWSNRNTLKNTIAI